MTIKIYILLVCFLVAASAIEVSYHHHKYKHHHSKSSSKNEVSKKTDTVAETSAETINPEEKTTQLKTKKSESKSKKSKSKKSKSNEPLIISGEGVRDDIMWTDAKAGDWVRDDDTNIWTPTLTAVGGDSTSNATADACGNAEILHNLISCSLEGGTQESCLKAGQAVWPIIRPCQWNPECSPFPDEKMNEGVLAGTPLKDRAEKCCTASMTECRLP